MNARSRNVYRAALADARAEYAEAIAKRDAIDQEIDRLDDEIKKLRSVIRNLAEFLGEPDGLPDEPIERPRRRHGRAPAHRAPRA